MFGKGPLKEHFCKSFVKKNCNEVAVNVNFHFSHYKSMQPEFLSDWDWKQYYSFPLPIDAIMWNMGRIGFRGDVIWKRWCTTTTDGWRMPAYIYYKLTYETLAQAS